MAESATDQSETARSALVLCASRGERSPCGRLAAGTDVTASLQVRMPAGTGPAPDPPAAVDRFGLLAVGSVDGDDPHGGDPTFDGSVVTDAVADPTDLEAIGVAVSRFCDRWSDETLAVCVDSLDPLFSHHEPQTVFEFTYYVLERLGSVDAFSHLHLDPTSHEESLVRSFGDLVDRVVDESSHASSPPTRDSAGTTRAEPTDAGVEGSQPAAEATEQSTTDPAGPSRTDSEASAAPNAETTDDGTTPSAGQSGAANAESTAGTVDRRDSTTGSRTPRSEATDEDLSELFGSEEVDEPDDALEAPSRPAEATDDDVDRQFSN